MTERQWWISAAPDEMLALVGGKVSDRKLRLFGVGCYRRVRHLIEGEPYHRGVEAAVAHLGGRVSLARWRSLWRAAWRFDGTLPGTTTAAINAAAAALAASVPAGCWPGVPDTRAACRLAATNAVAAMAESASGERVGGRRYDSARDAELAAQAALLRDVVGNPFRQMTLDPAWLGWDGGTAVRLAQAMDAEGTFDRLPILADALEEAGCADRELLAHCRGPGPHVPGCWVVDLLRCVD